MGTYDRGGYAREANAAHERFQAEELARKKAMQDLDRRTRFLADGSCWVLKQDSLLWYATRPPYHDYQHLTAEALEELAGRVQVEVAAKTMRENVFNRLAKMGDEELFNHLNMCKLSLDIAAAMGIKEETP